MLNFFLLCVSYCDRLLTPYCAHEGLILISFRCSVPLQQLHSARAECEALRRWGGSLGQGMLVVSAEVLANGATVLPRDPL